MEDTLRDVMPSACNDEETCVMSGSRDTMRTVGVTLAMGDVSVSIGASPPGHEPAPELVNAREEMGRIGVAVLDGGVAVRCNPKPALAGLNSRTRSRVHRPTASSAALKAWSCAATTYEPCQVRKEAAVRSVRRVPQGRRARAKRARGCGGAPVDHGCTAILED